MTHFDELYAKMINDPPFGEIGHRREQFRKMYVEGMKKALSCCTNGEIIYYRGTDCIDNIEQAIAEESK